MWKLKATGHHGSWLADVAGESLPCVHKTWWKSGVYHDPGDKRWEVLIVAIREKGASFLWMGHTQQNELATSASTALPMQ
jgi:hypothetical protein